MTRHEKEKLNEAFALVKQINVMQDEESNKRAALINENARLSSELAQLKSKCNMLEVENKALQNGFLEEQNRELVKGIRQEREKRHQMEAELAELKDRFKRMQQISMEVTA